MSTCKLTIEAWRGGKCFWRILSYSKGELIRQDDFRSLETAELYASGLNRYSPFDEMIIRPIAWEAKVDWNMSALRSLIHN